LDIYSSILVKHKAHIEIVMTEYATEFHHSSRTYQRINLTVPIMQGWAKYGQQAKSVPTRLFVRPTKYYTLTTNYYFMKKIILFANNFVGNYGPKGPIFFLNVQQTTNRITFTPFCFT